jgi:pimeloyl-ACP methyl ester carboxylesterase
MTSALPRGHNPWLLMGIPPLAREGSGLRDAQTLARRCATMREGEEMATFALIHGAADVGWYWHLVERELRARGHETVAPDLPCEDDAAGLAEYADTVARAAGHLRGSDLVVVAQSFGGFTAPLAAARLRARAIVLVTGMIPAPGEKPEDWPANTGWGQAIAEQAARDGGKTGNSDPLVAFYHDVPRDLAEQAVAKGGRPQSDTPGRSPWPLSAWPAIPTRFVLCTEDRFFPAGFMRRVVAERLGIIPDEIAAGHCVALSRPKELADLLAGYAASPGGPPASTP